MIDSTHGHGIKGMRKGGSSSSLADFAVLAGAPFVGGALSSKLLRSSVRTYHLCASRIEPTASRRQPGGSRNKTREADFWYQTAETSKLPIEIQASSHPALGWLSSSTWSVVVLRWTSCRRWERTMTIDLLPPRRAWKHGCCAWEHGCSYFGTN